MAWSITYLLTEFKPEVVKQLCLKNPTTGNLYLVEGEVNLLFVKDIEEIWHQVSGSAEIELDPDDLEAPSMFVSKDLGDLVKTPPKAFLSYLKELAQSTSLPVCFYCHETWAGGTEYENAWLYDGDKETLYVVDEKSETKSVYRNENGVWGKVNTNKTVLQLMLEYLGFESPENYFPPHTREFDWESHKVKCSTIAESISDE